jgi:PadR family transcriptional regulator AphA
MSGVSTIRLTETSYAVLRLLEHCEPATPYRLKQMAQESIFHFWTIPHTQLYTECARLADGGLLDEHREETGRRRRMYRLSATGRKALTQWRADPHAGLYELRDPGLLKLFCGADPAAVAAAQLDKHEERLERYHELLGDDLPEGARLSLESGIGHEKEYVRFWTRLKARGRGQ